MFLWQFVHSLSLIYIYILYILSVVSKIPSVFLIVLNIHVSQYLAIIKTIFSGIWRSTQVLKLTTEVDAFDGYDFTAHSAEAVEYTNCISTVE